MRLTPLEYVSGGIKDIDEKLLFYGSQKEPSFPSIVYYAAGGETERAFDRRITERTQAVRVEIRTRMPSEIERLDRQLISELKRGPLLRGEDGKPVTDDKGWPIRMERRLSNIIGGPIDQDETELESENRIHSRIRTFTIKV